MAMVSAMVSWIIVGVLVVVVGIGVRATLRMKRKIKEAQSRADEAAEEAREAEETLKSWQRQGGTGSDGVDEAKDVPSFLRRPLTPWGTATKAAVEKAAAEAAAKRVAAAEKAATDAKAATEAKAVADKAAAEAKAEAKAVADKAAAEAKDIVPGEQLGDRELREEELTLLPREAKLAYLRQRQEQIEKLVEIAKGFGIESSSLLVPVVVADPRERKLVLDAKFADELKHLAEGAINNRLSQEEARIERIRTGKAQPQDVPQELRWAVGLKQNQQNMTRGGAKVNSCSICGGSTVAPRQICYFCEGKTITPFPTPTGAGDKSSTAAEKAAAEAAAKRVAAVEKAAADKAAAEAAAKRVAAVEKAAADKAAAEAAAKRVAAADKAAAEKTIVALDAADQEAQKLARAERREKNAAKKQK